MPRRYWLFKSEPESYSYDALVKDKVAEWDGVRNYQARNFLRDSIQEGDGVLFYHSGGNPLVIVGTAGVTGKGYPDNTAWDAKSNHYDPKSSPENPIWFMVDIKPDVRFKSPVTVDAMRMNTELKDMMLLKRNRLSVQPVAEKEWNAVLKMGRT